jgi:hypothetical protein
MGGSREEIGEYDVHMWKKKNDILNNALVQ